MTGALGSNFFLHFTLPSSLMLFTSSLVNFRPLLNLSIFVTSSPSLASFHMWAWHYPGFYHHVFSRDWTEAFLLQDDILTAAILSTPPRSGNYYQFTQSVKSPFTPLNGSQPDFHSNHSNTVDSLPSWTFHDLGISFMTLQTFFFGSCFWQEISVKGNRAPWARSPCKANCVVKKIMDSV